MARRKQRNKSRVRTLILFLLIPLIVWFLAFLLWFYWYDLRKAFTKEDAPPRRSKPARQVETERRESVPAKPPKEQILDDDRKSLEDILKRRN